MAASSGGVGLRPPRHPANVETMRVLFAFMVAAAFGFRVAVSPFAWGCVPTGHHSADGPQHHQEHPHSGSDVPACECVAHAASTGTLVEPSEFAAVLSQPSSEVARYPLATAPATGPSAHRLPFSIGPPSHLG